MRAETVRVLKVFVASPGDVGPERKAAVKAIEWVSEHVAKPRGWRVEPLMWERDVLPEAGKDPQSVINAQIGEMRKVAVFLLIMRDRFGTPTTRAGSGTEEEYNRAVDARKGRRSPQRPHLLLCFGKPSAGADAKQRAKVEGFKAKVSKRAVRMDFGTAQDFRKQFDSFLTKWVSAELDRLTKAAKPQPSGTVGVTPGSALLLGDRVYRHVRQRETSEGTVLTLSVRSTAEERALRETRERMETVPYAFGLSSTRVRVSNVDFDRQNGRTQAVVTLTPTRAGSGAGYYGMGDEESREKMARRILLGSPVRKESNAWGLSSREESLPSVVPPLLARSADVAARAEARLRAVQALIESGVVTRIERLDIAAPTAKGVRLTFVGHSDSSWGGGEQTVRVEGTVTTKSGGKDSPPRKPKKDGPTGSEVRGSKRKRAP